MIEVFADVSCPFAYVQLHQLASRRTLLGKDVHIRTRAWPLELVNDGPTDPGKIADEVAALQAQVDSSLFAGFDAQRLPSTTLPALDLAALAYRHSGESSNVCRLNTSSRSASMLVTDRRSRELSTRARAVWAEPRRGVEVTAPTPTPHLCWSRTRDASLRRRPVCGIAPTVYDRAGPVPNAIQ